MARERVVVTDFSAGEITESYAGRIDLAVYRRAAAEIRGMVVRPDGGVTRRGPTVHVRTGTGFTPDPDELLQPGNMPSFILYSFQDGTNRIPFLAFVDGSNLRLRNTQDHTETTATTSLEEGHPLGTSGAFCAEDNFTTQTVALWTPGHAEILDLHTEVTTNRVSRQIAEVFQNRLITADREFGRLYFSVPLDLLNNDLTETVEIDDGEGGIEEIVVPTGALDIRPDFYGVESVRWIKSRGSLYIGTDQGEYEVSSAYAAFNGEPGGVMVMKISNIGTTQAEFFGDAMVMVKDSRIVEMQYRGQAQSYQTFSLMELQKNAQIVQIAVVEFGSHRYLFALDIKRDLWCMTASPSTQVQGWSRIEQNVWSIYSFDQDLYLVRENSGTFTIEVMGMDNLQYRGNRTPMEGLAWSAQKVYRDRGAFVTVADGTVSGDRLPASTEVTVYLFDGETYTEIGTTTTQSDGSLFDSYASGSTFLGADGVAFAVPTSGNEYVSRIKTLPIETATEYGPGIGVPTRISKIMVLVEETTAFRARVSGGNWQNWVRSEPYSGPVDLTVAGTNVQQATVEIESVDDHPLTVLSIQADVTKGGQV